jgi:hypothetical protein
MDVDHTLHVETEDERDYWECSCGASGSTAEGRGEVAAERHIGPSESRAYTSRRP